MTPEEFFSTRPTVAEYHSIVFSHPNFSAPVRLVANQFAAVTLGGNAHTPCPMTITPPEQTGDASPKLTMQFPRAVVGREFKRQLKLTAGSREPISVTYALYYDSLVTPKMTWQLYVSDTGGVTFGAESVSVTATDNNPMRQFFASIYDPAIFTGLELL